MEPVFETVPLDTLRPHPRNYHGHPADEIEHIKASIRSTGVYRNVVVADDSTVLAGHGVVEAARQLGLAEIRVARLPIPPDHPIALRVLVGDNEIARGATTDDRALTDLLRELSTVEDDLALLGTGFRQEDLDQFLADLAAQDRQVREVDPDEIPEARSKSESISQPGDLWVLGDHRLFCGDSTNREVVARLMGDDRADMMWTDPPYGVEYGAKNRFLQTIGRSDRLEEDIVGDSADPEALRALLSASFTEALRACRPGAVWFVAAPPGPPLGVFAAELLNLGVWRQLLCWVKNRPIFGRSDYHYQHENLFYGWAPGAAHDPPPHHSTSSVWNYDSPAASKLHPTQKPVALVTQAIGNHTTVGHRVYDPFAGSGTTLIACEELGRRCYAIEIDPVYCDVIVTRWEQFAGQTAVRWPG